MRAPRRPVRAVARRIKRPVQRVVGYWELRALAEDQMALIVGLQERLSEEIDRLDGYLVHHVDELRREIRGQSAVAPPPVLYSAEGVSAVVRFGGGYDLVIPSEEPGVLAYYVRHSRGGIEPGVHAVIASRLSRGCVAIDVGASVGLHAVTMAAAVGETGRVICYEPLPHVAAALEQTLLINGFGDRGRVERAAVTDAVGEVTLHVASQSPLSSLYALPESVVARVIRVPAVTLDDEVPPGERVDLVKLDIEGAEPRAWKGMQRVLNDNRDIAVVMEWSASHFARSGESPTDFLDAVRTSGFELFVIDNAESPGSLSPLDAAAATAVEGANVLVTRSTD